MTEPASDHQFRHPLGPGPERGRGIAVGEHVRWYRLFSPMAPMGGVNIWALRDGDGWAIIDTGFADPDTTAQWRVILDDLGAPVTRIVCTHFHPDHIGQVGMLQAKFDAPLFMTATEWHFARRLAAPPAEGGGSYEALLRRCGLDGALLQSLAAGRSGGFTTGLPERCAFIAAGETLRIGALDWKIEIGAGHSPAPAILTSDTAGLALVGDQLLMRITPHVGIDPDDPDGDPLGTYLDYLSAARTMPSGLLALPGHGPAFREPGLRAMEIAEHHRRSLEAILPALRTPRLVSEMLVPLFGRVPAGMGIVLAVTEALAHLNRLVVEGAATRSIGDDGRYRFAAI